MKAQHPFSIALAFFAIYIIWGTTYLAISFGLKGFPPFILSALRFITAGLILLIWRMAKGEKFPSKNIMRVCMISGCLMLIGGSGLVTWGEKYVSSGQTAIIMATEPFLFILLDKKRRNGYLSNRLVMAGLITGFIGLILFFKAAVTSVAIVNAHMFIIANAVLFLSTILWVTGSLYAKNNLVSNHSNFMTTSLQLLAAGIGSAIISTFTKEWKQFSINDISATAWYGLMYLIVMGSLVAYLAFTWLISIRPPALVSTHTYVNPVVAVILGLFIAGEIFSGRQVAALLIILTGMLLTNLPGYKMMHEKQRLV